MRYYHAPTIESELTQASTPSDKVIFTTRGRLKIRKNGRQIIVIDRGNGNEEWLKVTPLDE